VGQIVNWHHQKIKDKHLSKWKDLEIKWEDEVTDAPELPIKALLNKDKLSKDKLNKELQSAFALANQDSKDLCKKNPGAEKSPVSKLLEIRREIHQETHRCEPLGGPQVNGILSGIVKQIGIEEAELVLRWFYRAPVHIYKTSGHDLKIMRRDLSKLVTEARTKQPIIPDYRVDNFNRSIKQISQKESLEALMMAEENKYGK
jgi:hypothetical protein